LYQNHHTMSRWHRILILTATAALFAAFVASAAPASATYSDDVTETYLVTVENLSENQTLTPAVVAAHDDHFKLFRNNRAASDGLQQLAENGGVPALLAELNADSQVESVEATGGPIAPGASASTMITTTSDANRISVAAMLICTNDGFASVRNARASQHRGQTTRYGKAWDTGTEINTQLFDDLVPPCSGIPDVGTGMTNPDLAEDGTVRRHRGITRDGDLSPVTHGFENPVIKVTIERVATYEVTITNLTSGQPITPAVLAVHAGRNELFQRGTVASDGIQQLAENGGVPVLAAEAAANPDIAASTVVGLVPLAPRTSATASLEVIGKGNRFSLAAMLVCSNDGFGGINSKRLPTRIGSERSYHAKALDAGTEQNTELFADLVPPCDGDPDTGTGATNPVLAEGGTIHRHAGIAGGGDLADNHAWHGPVLKVTIERTG
jgi:hypothetical protein